MRLASRRADLLSLKLAAPGRARASVAFQEALIERPAGDNPAVA
jgi:hypothetical protein